MNKIVSKFALVAGLVLAMAFIFSCSSDDGGGGGTQSGVSSSSDDGEGNSQNYSYCLIGEMCLDGPFTLNDCNSLRGLPSNNCPYGGVEPSSSSSESGISSSVPPSSSSIEPSSSSAEPSSSSIVLSSSSVMQSSSSAEPSSSSVVLSSSSFMQSSSSAHPSSSSVPPSSSSVEPSSSSAESSSSSVVLSSSSAPTLACTMTATTGMVGVAISPAPAVTCNGSTVTAGLMWTPADLIPTAEGSAVPVNVSVSSGVCSGMAFRCGSIAVSSPLTLIYEGQSYKTIEIGTQMWMAENLNYAVPGSKCYDNNPDNCDIYGILYNWSAANGACPEGWHLPKKEDWQALVDLAGGEDAAGKKLKAKSGWNNNGNGTDDYGFSALPGGSGYSDGSFDNVGNFGYWWSDQDGDSDAYYQSMYHGEDARWGSSPKSDLLSVRCLKD